MNAEELENSVLLIYLRDIRALELERKCVRKRTVWKKREATLLALVGMAALYGILAMLGVVLNVGMAVLVLLVGAFLWAMSAVYCFLTEEIDALSLSVNSGLEEELRRSYGLELLPEDDRNFWSVWAICQRMEQGDSFGEALAKEKKRPHGITRKTALRCRRDAEDPEPAIQAERMLQTARRDHRMEQYKSVLENHRRVKRYFESV